MLTLPALLWAGVSPAQTLATNKLQACFGSGSASWQFWRAGQVAPREFLFAILTCGFGAALGALSVNWLNREWLQTIIPVMLLGAAAFFFFSPAAPQDGRPPKLSPQVYAMTAALGIGFYDGFFGPGTGSFLVLSLVTLLGMGLGTATARTKVLNFSSNIASLAIFLYSGEIVWGIGLIMAVGQGIGARLGSNLVMEKGGVIIRPFLVAMSLAMTVRVIVSTQNSVWHNLLVSMGLGT